MSYNDIPINISTLSNLLSPIFPLALERPSYQNPISLSASTTNTVSGVSLAGSATFRLLILGNRKCSNIFCLELLKLRVLCRAIYQYYTCHRLLSEPLQNPRVFYSINAATIRLHI